MIIPMGEDVKYHMNRRTNILDTYLSQKDWQQIDSRPGERFLIMEPNGYATQMFDELDVKAFYAFGRRSKRYHFFRRLAKDSSGKFSVAIMRKAQE